MVGVGPCSDQPAHEQREDDRASDRYIHPALLVPRTLGSCYRGVLLLSAPDRCARGIRIGESFEFGYFHGNDVFARHVPAANRYVNQQLVRKGPAQGVRPPGHRTGSGHIADTLVGNHPPWRDAPSWSANGFHASRWYKFWRGPRPGY